MARTTGSYYTAARVLAREDRVLRDAKYSLAEAESIWMAAQAKAIYVVKSRLVSIARDNNLIFEPPRDAVIETDRGVMQVTRMGGGIVAHYSRFVGEWLKGPPDTRRDGLYCMLTGEKISS